VVLVYNLTEPSGVFVWLGAKLIGAKAVVALCDINIPGRTVDDTLARRIDFRVQQWIVPWFDGLLVVNRKIVEDFAPKTPFTWVVGGGTEAFLETPVVNDVRFEEQDSRFVIAFAGMLTEVNGIPELLDAFSSLEDGKTAYRLRIAGKGTLEPLVREAVAHDPRIDFLGYVPFEKIVELYSMADVLINMRITQRIKTDYFFPSKLLEYMSTGIPTITTAVGHAEQFADCVFMVHEETAQALADKMRYIASLDREQRKLMGEKARAYIQENLTWEIQGQRVVEFIKTKIIDE
jgi:glycosyltransferase involved in cell wall biosynthesis